MKPQRIFISGGAGVIGRELVPLLHAAGHEILVGDLKSRPRDWAPSVRYRQGDLNRITVAELELFAPTVFVHLAATFERSTETYGFWDANQRHNVRLSHHLMTLLKDQPDLRRVIFASSYLIYDPRLYTFSSPQASARRLREDDPIYPRNLTGMAKLAHEIELRFIDSFRREHFTCAIARIFRGYGRGSHCVLSRWVRQLLAGEAITVYRPEGLFDYIYAGETAKGLAKLIEHADVSGVINLGSDRARRVGEVIEVLRRHFPAMTVEEGEAADVPYEASQANMDAFRAATGWMPERNLEECIPLLIEHERTQRTYVETPVHKAVIVSSVSGKVPLVRSVREAALKIDPALRIEGADCAGAPLASHFTDGFWQMPRLNDLTVDGLIAHCRERGVHAIVPTRDGELSWFAQAAPQLMNQGIHVMVSAPEAIDACVDKLRFAEFSGAIPAFAVLPADATGRWVVKERFGAGARGVGLNLTPREAAAHARELTAPIFQPFVSGREVSADLYVDRCGRIKGCVVRTRDVVVRGESQITTTLDAPEVTAACTRIASSLPFYGHIVMQAIIGGDGAVQVIECNARFGGASSLSIAAGLDSFYWFLLEAGGEDLAGYPCTYNPARPLRQIRHPSDLICAA